MSTLNDIREAERAGDTLRLTRLLIRAGFIKKEGAPCVHCGEWTVGLGEWKDGISAEDWTTLNDIGMPYRCTWSGGNYNDLDRDGCGGLYVIKWR